MVEYQNKKGEVPVGELYEKVVLDDGTEIIAGDSVVGWDEPDIIDIEYDGHQVTSMLTTGFVDKIFKRPDGPEITIKNASLGRLSVDSNYLQIPAERPDRFLSSHAEGCIVEYWYNGEYDMEEK